jgi:hypothetical protein
MLFTAICFMVCGIRATLAHAKYALIFMQV